MVRGEPEYDDEARTVIRNPAVIVEILSPTSEAFDRGEKFARYRMWNPTLTDYLLLSQDKPRVEHFTRQADGSWRYDLRDGLDDVAPIPPIGVTLRLADVYDRVKFPEPEGEAGEEGPDQPTG